MRNLARRSGTDVAIGIDLGGTGIRYACVAADGRVVGSPEQRAVVDRGKTAVLAQLRAVIEKAATERWRVAAIGVGVPGFIRRDRGIRHRAARRPVASPP